MLVEDELAKLEMSKRHKESIAPTHTPLMDPVQANNLE
jgi:hypothetical protein